MNKKELLDHIDSTVDNIVDEVLKYVEDSIEEKKKDKFFKNFMSDKMLKWNEDLYDFDLEDVELGDIVFGAVYGDDIKSARYPFKIIYKSENKLILLGIKNINKKYNFVQACNLKWDIKLMVDGKIKSCHSTIISKELIDKYNLDSLLSKQNLAVGFHYWTESRYNSSNAWFVYAGGYVDSTGIISDTLGALPCITINL